MKKETSIFLVWGKKINWDKRVKAVCKPCWEIKYCPYGPLVEEFPLKKVRDERSCRIFGHDCPVFYVAEPFTETKELRRITRTIPRVIQFKVLKRENQICSECGNSVKDEDVEFDHIIPWSKGGATEDYNIRLLCSKCNKKRGNKFETTHLIESFHDHVSETYDVDIIEFVKISIDFGHRFKLKTKETPKAQDFADGLAGGELTAAEHQAEFMYRELTEFFGHRRPEELKKDEFDFLRHRWGYVDNEVHKIKESIKKFNFDIERAIEIDKSLLNRLGLTIKDRVSDRKKWEKH